MPLDTNLDLELQNGFRLDEWEIHPQLNRAIANGVTHTLEGKVMAVLVELAKQPSKVITKSALLDAVWPNQSVAEGVLTRAVHELRQTLGDDANESRFIETVPRRGYRLICEPGPTRTSTAGNRRWWSMLAVAGIVVVAIVAWTMSDEKVNPSTIDSVAVLPFANLTGSPANDYIGDGLAEAVIHTIAQQPQLGVTARTSSFALRDSGMTAEEMGERLGVARIVEGSVREERGVQRITIQLIDVKTGLHDSSVTLDVVGGDLFNAQQRIGQTIESMLADAGAPIVPNIGERSAATVGPAYDLFLKGRAALHNRSAVSLRNARAYFEEALQLDKNFADAHAGLAQFYLVSRAYLQLDAERSRTLASTASKAALALDPNNVDALMVLAAVASDSGEFETSIEKFEMAIRLQPSNAQAHQWYGESLATLGYVIAARDSIETALRLNPLAGSTNSVRSKAATFFLDDDKLLSAGKQGSALGALLASRTLSVHFFRSGDVDAFGREIASYHKVIGVDASAANLLMTAMEGGIEKPELVDRLALIAVPSDNYFSRELAFLGLHEKALDAMSRGLVSGGGFRSDIWLPEFTGARALPEFPELIRSIGLDQYWQRRGLPDVCRQSSPESFCAEFSN